MTFPNSAYAFLDTFDRANGALGPNWIQAGLDFGGNPLTITSGQVTASVDAHVNAMAWAVPMAAAITVYVRIDALANDAVVALALTPTPLVTPLGLLGTQNIRFEMQNNAGAKAALLKADGGTASTNIPTYANGDLWGFAFSSASNLATNYRVRPGIGIVSVQQLDVGEAARNLTQGWYAYLEVQDTADRVKNFGAETLPRANFVPFLGQGAC